MRARGTHALVQMVREQVGVLIESTGKVASAVDGFRKDVTVLGRMVNALAEAVDDHESRLAAIEK